jgi:hypothetical protein
MYIDGCIGDTRAVDVCIWRGGWEIGDGKLEQRSGVRRRERALSVQRDGRGGLG